MKKLRFLTSTIALACLGLSAAHVSAHDYYVVVPVKARTATSAIGVHLNPSSLPAGDLGTAYGGFDFKTALAVTGDPSYTGYGVQWGVVGGSLPEGMLLSEDGRLVGTPRAPGQTTFTMRASYKGKSTDALYVFTTEGFYIGLGSGVLPVVNVGKAYSYYISSRLQIQGESGYTGKDIVYTVVAGTLPDGLTLSADGLLSGTATKSSQGSVTFRVTYAGRSGDQTYQLNAFSIEDNVPGAYGQTGDGNGDGVQDSSQVNVHSMPAVVTGQPYVTVAVSSGYVLRNATAKLSPAGLPRNVKLPVGDLDFRIENVSPGGTVEVALYVPSNLSMNSYFEKNTDGLWVNLTKSVALEGTKTKILFDLVDGGAFDKDGVANGVIEL